MASNGGRLHLYGAVELGRRESFGPVGLLRDEVWAIPYQDVSLLVSRAVPGVLSELPKERLLEVLTRHQAILEAALTLHNLVPIKFGVSAADEGEAREILRQGHTAFRAALEASRGKVELDVVAKWNDARVFDQIYEENAEIRRLRADAGSLPEGQSKLMAQIRLGQAVASVLRESRAGHAQRILEVIEPVALQVRRNALADDLTVCNLALLLESNKQSEIRDRVEELSGHWKDLISFWLIGPLPLHSFHTLQVERVEITDVREACDLLGLSVDASESKVKAAFRDWARRFHPDAHQGKSETSPKFLEGQAAYRRLLAYRRGLDSSGNSEWEGDSFLVCAVDLPGEEEVIPETVPEVDAETMAEDVVLSSTKTTQLPGFFRSAR